MRNAHPRSDSAARTQHGGARRGGVSAKGAGAWGRSLAGREFGAGGSASAGLSRGFGFSASEELPGAGGSPCAVRWGSRAGGRSRGTVGPWRPGRVGRPRESGSAAAPAPGCERASEPSRPASRAETRRDDPGPRPRGSCGPRSRPRRLEAPAVHLPPSESQPGTPRPGILPNRFPGACRPCADLRPGPAGRACTCRQGTPDPRTSPGVTPSPKQTNGKGGGMVHSPALRFYA